MKSAKLVDGLCIGALFNDGTVERYGKLEYWDVESITYTNMACAAKKCDGTVVTWGRSLYGGDPGSEKQSKLIDIIFIASTDKAFAAMTRDENIICWGNENEFSDARLKCRRLWKLRIETDNVQKLTVELKSDAK